MNKFFPMEVLYFSCAVHHMIHLFLRFIGDDCEQLKSLAKSGEFWSGPMTRNLSVA